MIDGFIKVAAATPQIKVADCDFNKKSIINEIIKAEQQGVKLLCLPELCITGYTCADLFFQDTLINSAKEALFDIIEKTNKLDIIYAVGMPIKFKTSLLNCAVVVYMGEILGVVPKTNIPNHSEFSEARHFCGANEIFDDYSVINLCNQDAVIGTNLVFTCENLSDFSFGVELCEDLWSDCPPSVKLSRNGANIILNLSASNEICGKSLYRRDLVKMQSAKSICGYVFCSAGDGESTTDTVFSGHNIIAENGTVLSESALFNNELTISEIDVSKLSHERQRINTFTLENDYVEIPFEMPLTKTDVTRKIPKSPFVPEDSAQCVKRCEEIFNIQSYALKKRIEHINCKSAVIGISGGLDSCLALLVTVRAMDLLNRPRTDIIAVTMPCFGTTSRTKTNAEILCEQLGVTFRDIDIKSSVDKHFEDIGQDKDNYDVTYENAQARERTQVLMDISNMTNGIVIGTGDLSELALGFATYNGDHMSMYAVNAGVPKTLVRHLVKYYADICTSSQLKEAIYDIYNTPVSPELLPPDENDDIAQKTEELVGPYQLHDFYLYYVLRFGFSPKKIYRIAKIAFKDEYDDSVLLYWLKLFYRRFFTQQFKRSCLPDGPKVGSVGVSPRADLFMPSDALATIWQNELNEI